MPAPPYMRFFVDDYCNATISLTIEEQGAYMRLLCAMWKHGGKVVHDDAVIAKILPIHINKWRKIKPRLMPFLSDDEDGYLIQSRLVAEYQFSAGDKKGTKSSTHGVTPHVTPGVTRGVTPPVTPRVTHGVTPQVAKSASPATLSPSAQQNQRVDQTAARPLAQACARVLDQSRSIPKQKIESRILDDGGGTSGEQPAAERSAEFAVRIDELFALFDLVPPSDRKVVGGWVAQGCDPFDHILPAVERVLNNLNPAIDPPRSWKYFAAEVFQQKQQSEEKHHG